jgi:hypothetical protein
VDITVFVKHVPDTNTPHRRPELEHCIDATAARWTTIDRDYEALRIDMQTLFGRLGIATPATARAQHPSA